MCNFFYVCVSVRACMCACVHVRLRARFTDGNRRGGRVGGGDGESCLRLQHLSCLSGKAICLRASALAVSPHPPCNPHPLLFPSSVATATLPSSTEAWQQTAAQRKMIPFDLRCVTSPAACFVVPQRLIMMINERG